MSDDKLMPLRQKIDAIDAQILDFLNQRARFAQEVGHVKAKTNAPVLRPEREAQVLRKAAERNPGPLLGTDVQTIFREVMSACRALEKRVVVAYLGPEGSFSEQAVYQQFGHAVESFPCTSINEVFHDVEAGTADFGVVPMENSSEGVNSYTRDLLLHTTLTISGEVRIPIRYKLMTKSGNMDDAICICAHSQALSQCTTWLNLNYPGIERRAVTSSAEAVRMASKDATVAAIAGEIVGQKCNLQTVNTHIQDGLNSRARFAVIGHLRTAPSGQDLTSIVLSVPDEADAVYNLLELLAKHGVSMARFESRPECTGAWKYYFHVDLEGHEQDQKVLLEDLRQNASFFKLLGSYPKSL
ncbi:chorismate mutase, clade 2 [Herbaspirillum sp. CF444]|uniref:chorismate mutase n=1 Tax=Herbaspirillum sp. CF444 TaxID=1144319 RepID=UPI00027251DF|nr:chorismate mutase [Herbaspirillum sp. CF444]EJL88091.1 chorismate mutase, clade 2 [Herbaspirillum sp. CF444]